MKRRLRHPIRSITEPYGKAGLLVAILALVLAMVGGAYAAGGLTKQQEKQVVKIAKKYAGKPGAPGTNGTNGTNGAPGKEGPEGKQGPKGDPGTNGANGTFSSEPLPSGQTLTGMWSVGPGGEALKEANLHLNEGGEVEAEYEPGKFRKEKIITGGYLNTGKVEWSTYGAISFPIEVKSPPVTLLPTTFFGTTKPIGLELEKGTFSEYELHGFGQKEFEEAEEAYEKACPGSFEEPKAGAGFLCVYFKAGSALSVIGNSAELEVAHSSGIVMPFVFQRAPEAAAGSWAVTAE